MHGRASQRLEYFVFDGDTGTEGDDAVTPMTVDFMNRWLWGNFWFCVTGSHLVSFRKTQCAVRVPTAAQAQEVLQ